MVISKSYKKIFQKAYPMRGKADSEIAISLPRSKKTGKTRGVPNCALELKYEHCCLSKLAENTREHVSYRPHGIVKSSKLLFATEAVEQLGCF